MEQFVINTSRVKQLFSAGRVCKQSCHSEEVDASDEESGIVKNRRSRFLALLGMTGGELSSLSIDGPKAHGTPSLMSYQSGSVSRGV
jgi:hypothetical protein